MTPVAPGFAVSSELLESRGAGLGRARRLADGRPVLLKWLGAEASQERLAHLERELDLLQRLHPPGVCAALGLQRPGRTVVLVLDDPGGEPLSRQLEHRPMPLEAFLELAAGLARALGSVHRQRITLRSVNPASVLWDPASASATFLELGFADERSEASAPIEAPLAPGMLAYMSPEQTGRMSRRVDYRTDLYSLGVTLYEALTGTLPFHAGDPLEWLHSHIARTAHPPRELAEGIPRSVSDLVMKLLAKDADDRYQTASGLESDLARLLELWRTDRAAVEAFRLGEHDRPEELLIPQRLYGRDEARRQLAASLDAVASARAPELVVVSGAAGSGRTALAGELARIAAERGLLFASGACDQGQPAVPHKPLLEAFRGLIAQLLTESRERLAQRRERLGNALGINARLIVDAVPLAELVLGKGPEAPELPPAEARNRFDLVVRDFVAALASPEHPLILFLDDLQWGDPGTLELVEQLVTHRETGAVLVVGAARDTGLAPGRPLRELLESMRESGASLRTIELGPLSFESCARLVADALHAEPPEIEPLARMVFEKTRGNPFFVIQFLTALRAEGLLRLDPATRRWSWDLERIRAKGYTDNVAGLLTGKLELLSPESLEVLKAASCIGGRFDRPTLAALTSMAPAALSSALDQALREGLLLRVGEDGFGFVHDRVRQTANGMLGEPRRQAIHLAIGRAMLARQPEPMSREQLFGIAAQLDAGLALISDPAEKREVAALNLAAARQALASSAFQAARGYALAAWSLLQPQDWEADYELQRELHELLAQGEYLNGNLTRGYALAKEALAQLRTEREKAHVLELVVVGLTLEGAYDKAVQTGREGLALLGIELPREPYHQALREAVAEIDMLLADRDPLDLLELPKLQDPRIQAAQRILQDIDVPAYIADPALYPLIIARLVRHSLLHGNSFESCKSYVNFGLVLGSLFGRYERGYRYAQLGWRLSQRLGASAVQCKTGLAMGAFILPWVRPIAESVPYFEQGLQAGLATGDLQFVPYLLYSRAHLAFVAATPLPSIDATLEQAFGWATSTRNQWALDSIRALRFAVSALRGSPDPGRPSAEESAFAADLTRRDNRSSLCVYHCYLAQRLLLAGAAAEAVGHARIARRYSRNILGSTVRADAHWLHALARVERLVAAGVELPGRLPDRRLRRDRALLRRWSRSCPSTFLHKRLLLEAELARAQGRWQAAMRLFEKAIRVASAHGFIQDEALADLLAARFYRQEGFDRIADTYLREARDCLGRWGAKGLVVHLEREFPWLVEPRAAGPLAGIDISSLVRALRAISGEMELPRLLEVLMRTVIEKAGAERGVLLLARGEDLSIGSEARVAGERIEVSSQADVPLRSALPMSLVRFATRTGQGILLDDIREHPTFGADAYVRSAGPLSVFCLPLLRHRRLIGVLYLENHLVRGAFTARQREQLELLAAQAAVSLDNAANYQALRNREEEVRTIVSASPIAIAVTDREQRFLMLNERFVELFGWTPEDVPTQEAWWARAYPDERYRAQLRDAWSRLRPRAGEPGEIGPFEARVRCRNGEERYVEVRAVMAGDRAFLTFTDLTERKRTEEERERLMEAAQAANKEKDQFLAVLSHELRNPLAAIQSGIELLRRTPAASEPRVRRALEVIERNARLQTRLVNDLLDLSRVVRGQVVLKRGPVRLDAVAGMALQASQAEAARSKVTLEFHPSELWVYGDMDRLHQVVMNLVSNAVKFTPAGGRVTVSVEQEEGNGRVVVADTGYGIEPGRLPTIFKMFQPGAIGGQRASGLGIGLTLVKNLTEMHGGRVWAESAGPGLGSRFTVELPLIPAPQVAQLPVHEARPAGAPIRVLLVEDNEDARAMLAEILPMLGYEVLAAESGEAGLRMLEKHPQLEAILADIGLPGIDGYEFLRRSRQPPYDARVPAFAVTGYGREQDVRRAREAGFSGHFVKPVDLDALDRQIREVLGREVEARV